MNNVAALATDFGTNVQGIDPANWGNIANLDWNVNEEDLFINVDDHGSATNVEGKKALVNSKTGTILGVVSDKYQVVQPQVMLNTFSQAVNEYGFEMDRLGSYGDGKVIWGRADMHQAFNLNNNDPIDYFMYFVTSTDGSAATHAFISTMRAACMNALNIASAASDIHMNVRHSREFKPQEFETRMSMIDIAKGGFERDIQLLSDTPLKTPKSFGEAFCTVYGYVPSEDGRSRTRWMNKNKEIYRLMLESPGASLANHAHSYWNFLNAITFDVDHNNKSRTDENAHRSIIMRSGAKKKEDAFKQILELAEATYV